ncbi:hypothetical protein A3A60_02720 [Candidatus Curtissbacteria bacterium RIFCSPLOWO2_01_FULL_42_26]|uniref:Phospholipid/glycerol acyltransferase domain-containing protein n=1 Tax=Candidatus Curtissbacteria bacterium RIFCSPLOWO2_01_FULL_42_26 TaxID=1797729 RepID=A0A1F5I3A2_9BACT|nr:MAG: hypothetical protein A3A60_02720 [Candidatus Curtissbacteria bacterium RIFCSPLOWO2_01_FULL_42_26]
MAQKPTLDKLFADIYKSYKDQKRRNILKDFETILKLKKIKYELTYQTKVVPKIPTIIIANHFTRPLLLRKSLLTTSESMITSAIITKAASHLLGDKITWVVKNDLKTNIFFLSIRLRKIQLASIYTHNFIGVAQNYPFGEFQKWAKLLKSGYSIGVYPEGLVSSQMRETKPGFDKLPDCLKSRKTQFQILPVSIYYAKSMFLAKANEPIQPLKNSTETVNTAMLSIAASLPDYLQGFYRENVHLSKLQARQQPANGQTREFPEPEASAI